MRLTSMVAAAAAVVAAEALTWPSFISSSMVLQRDVPITLWGIDAPGGTVSATFFGQQYSANADSVTGRFELAFPATPATSAPFAILVNGTSGATVFNDLLIGDVILCSGQSNAELDVLATVDEAQVAANATAYANLLRIFQVAMLDSYANATQPQANLSASIPWSRATAASVGGMSAVCYYTALQAVQADPTVPIGAIATSWGGVAIQVWMSPESLAKCPAADKPQTPQDMLLNAARTGAGSRERSQAVLAQSILASQPHSSSLYPSIPSCLYNSMLAPLLALPIKAVVWYQGEANSGAPTQYPCLLTSMIADWRSSWAKVGSNALFPFVFVQLAPWPLGDNGQIAEMRQAMSQIPALSPNTGMVVAADFGDPAGAMHPIHPPFKHEVGRRAWLWLSQGVSSPKPVNVTVDPWDASWGTAWHYGMGTTSVCGGGAFQCAGIRVTFDQPVKMRSFYSPVPASVTTQNQDSYGFITGAASGFEAWAEQCEGTACANVWNQPLALTAQPDPYTITLNVTWIAYPNATASPMKVLRYGWHDYPTAMPIVSAVNELPVGPFNASLAVASVVQ